MRSVILASASTTRAAMLQAAGVTVEILPARIDEASVKGAMLAEAAPPRDLADKLAELKALRASSRSPGQLVLGADQVLVCDGQVFDKPADRADARNQLASLRGKPHRLLSAAVVARDGVPLWRHVGQADLVMRPFTESFLDTYLDLMGDDVTKTVGGYMLEGLGVQLFASIWGDHFTILGLPLLEFLGFLRAQGVLVE